MRVASGTVGISFVFLGNPSGWWLAPVLIQVILRNNPAIQATSGNPWFGFGPLVLEGKWDKATPPTDRAPKLSFRREAEVSQKWELHVMFFFFFFFFMGSQSLALKWVCLLELVPVCISWVSIETKRNPTAILEGSDSLERRPQSPKASLDGTHMGPCGG